MTLPSPMIRDNPALSFVLKELTHRLSPSTKDIVFLTVTRDFDEVEVQVSIKDGKVLDAWVVVAVGEPGMMPRWANGAGIELTLEESAKALKASK